MKITDVKTCVVGNPPPGIGGRYFIFVKLTTDGGVVGYGEAYNATFGPHVTARMIEDMAERYLVGPRPARHREPSSAAPIPRASRSARTCPAMGCFSALEIACWDIIGKEAGKPVYKLLGGQVHETLRSYTYLYPHSGSVYTDEARATRTSTTIPISPPNAPAATSSRASTPSSSIRPARTRPSTGTSRG